MHSAVPVVLSCNTFKNMTLDYVIETVYKDGGPI